MMIVRRLVALLVGAVVVVALGVAGGVIRTESTDAAKQTITSWIDDTTGSHATPLTAQPVTGTPQGSGGSAADEVRQLLARVQVVSGLPEQPGYERSCRRGKACVFGPPWTDDSDAAMAHNGCDTRNDILRTQLEAVQLDPKTRGCTVLSGVLDPDPYTGAVLPFRKGTTSSDIEIDHVFPLEAAWHAGAHDWPLPSGSASPTTPPTSSPPMARPTAPKARRASPSGCHPTAPTPAPTSLPTCASPGTTSCPSPPPTKLSRTEPVDPSRTDEIHDTEETPMTTTLTPLRRVAAAALLAGSIATGLGFAAAPASAAVTPIGTVDGHRAFGIGPHSSAEQCAPTANRLTNFGAKKFGPKFGTCYRAGNGQWWAISPWSA